MCLRRRCPAIIAITLSTITTRRAAQLLATLKARRRWRVTWSVTSRGLWRQPPHAAAKSRRLREDDNTETRYKLLPSHTACRQVSKLLSGDYDQPPSLLALALFLPSPSLPYNSAHEQQLTMSAPSRTSNDMMLSSLFNLKDCKHAWRFGNAHTGEIRWKWSIGILPLAYCSWLRPRNKSCREDHGRLVVSGASPPLKVGGSWPPHFKIWPPTFEE